MPRGVEAVLGNWEESFRLPFLIEFRHVLKSDSLFSSAASLRVPLVFPFH